MKSRETRVPGNQTKFEMLVQTGVQYGIQICAVFSNRQSKNLFNIVPVIPFTCSPCNNTTKGLFIIVIEFLDDLFLDSLNCIECSKIEDPENISHVNCSGKSCNADSSTHFISMSTAELDVKKKNKTTTTVNGNSVIATQRHSKIVSY